MRAQTEVKKSQAADQNSADDETADAWKCHFSKNRQAWYRFNKDTGESVWLQPATPEEAPETITSMRTPVKKRTLKTSSKSREKRVKTKTPKEAAPTPVVRPRPGADVTGLPAKLYKADPRIRKRAAERESEERRKAAKLKAAEAEERRRRQAELSASPPARLSGDDERMDTAPPPVHFDFRLPSAPVAAITDSPLVLQSTKKLEAEQPMEVDALEGIKEYRAKKELVGRSLTYLDSTSLTSPRQTEQTRLLLVMDTCVMIDNWQLVGQAVGVGEHVKLVLPWVVLHELDRLNHGTATQTNQSLLRKIHNAIDFIQNFSQDLHFESPVDSSSQLQSFEIWSNDDRILKCALQLMAKESNCRVVLVTNDRMLRVKALAGKLPTISGKELDNVEEMVGAEISFSGPVLTSAVASERPAYSDSGSAGRRSVSQVLTEAMSTAARNSAPTVEQRSVISYDDDTFDAPVAPPPQTRPAPSRSRLPELQLVLSVAEKAIETVFVAEMRAIFKEHWRDILKVKAPLKWTVESLLLAFIHHNVAVTRYIWPQIGHIEKLERIRQFVKQPNWRGDEARLLHVLKTLLQSFLMPLAVGGGAHVAVCADAARRVNEELDGGVAVAGRAPRCLPVPAVGRAPCSQLVPKSAPAALPTDATSATCALFTSMCEALENQAKSLFATVGFVADLLPSADAAAVPPLDVTLPVLRDSCEHLVGAVERMRAEGGEAAVGQLHGLMHSFAVAHAVDALPTRTQLAAVLAQPAGRTALELARLKLNPVVAALRRFSARMDGK